MSSTAHAVGCLVEPSVASRLAFISLSFVLATAALSTVAQAQIGPTDPPCGASGNTVTCSGAVTAGDLGQGLSVSGPPYDTLIINGLSGTAIAPASGVPGIYFRSSTGGNITIDSDVTGIPGIVTSNAGGIYATSGLSASGSGHGGDVSVTANGSITVDNGNGIYITSNINSESFNSSGLGISTSAIAGDVAVSNNGAITATGFYTVGISAHNTSSSQVTDTFSGPSSSAYFATAAGGSLTVINDGEISALGTNVYRDGIEVENYSGSGVGSTYGSPSGTYSAVATGGATKIVNSGTIITSGTQIYGIAARDDTGADAYNDSPSSSADYQATAKGGSLSLTNDGHIGTAGQSALGIRVDSYTNTTAYNDYDSASGTFSATSIGETVSITNRGTITTTGSYAEGIFAIVEPYSEVRDYSSSGISSASYFASVTGSILTISNDGYISTVGPGAFGINALNLGLSVASSSNGAASGPISATTTAGAATVINAGTIKTTGDSASGITVANSFGAQAQSPSSSSVVSATAAGAILSITNDGNISTVGTSAAGISAANSVSSAVDGGAPQSAASATGDLLTITNNGTITVTGDGSLAIAASNVAASSASGSSSATAGNVRITNSGDLSATGANGVAIEAQSLAFGTGMLTNGDITIAILGGTVTGGSGSGSGIKFDDGADNHLTNHGTIQALSGLAVVGGNGDESIDNDGLIIGNVDLGTGANVFNNRSSGTFRSGASVNIGAGNSLVNAGTLSPFGAGVIGTTAVTGNLSQATTGTFAVDLDLTGHAADSLDVNGTANLQGTVAVGITSLPGATSQQFTILSSADTTHSDLAVLASPALHATLSYPDTHDVVLGISVDFSTPGLTANETSLANYFDASLASGPSGLDPVVLALLNTSGLDGYKTVLDRLSPEHYLAQVEDTVQANLVFIDSMMSCPDVHGRPNYIYEGQCYWAKVSGRSYGWDRTASNVGGDTQGWTAAGGIQVALSETLRLGFAGSYEHNDLSTNNNASSDGDRGEGGVVLKDRWGNTSFALAGFGGYGSFDTRRGIGFGLATAEGDQAIAFGGAHARISQLFDRGGWYLKPMLDLDAMYLDYGGFREHGGGAANLAVHGNSDWVLSARPAIEIGSQFRAADGSFVRPYLRVGGLFFDDNDFAVTSNFLSAPSGVSPFTVASKFDRSYFDIGAGLDLLTLDGINVKLNYEGLFAPHSDANSGGVKVGLKF